MYKLFVHAFLCSNTLKSNTLWGEELDQDDLDQKVIPLVSGEAQAQCPVAGPDTE